MSCYKKMFSLILHVYPIAIGATTTKTIVEMAKDRYHVSDINICLT